MLSKGRISHITIPRYSERSHTLSNTKLHIWVLQKYNQVQADLPLIEWCSRNPNLTFLHVWNSPAILPSNHSSFIKESKFILEFARVCQTLWSTQFLSSPDQSPLKEPDTWFKVRLLPKCQGLLETPYWINQTSHLNLATDLERTNVWVSTGQRSHWSPKWNGVLQWQHTEAICHLVNSKISSWSFTAKVFHPGMKHVHLSFISTV